MPRNAIFYILFFLTIAGQTALVVCFIITVGVHNTEGENISLIGRQKMLAERFSKQVFLIKEGMSSVASLKATEKKLIQNLIELNKKSEAIIHKTDLENAIENALNQNKDTLLDFFNLAEAFIASEKGTENYSNLLNQLMDNDKKVLTHLERTSELMLQRYDNKIQIFNSWIIFLLTLVFILSMLLIFLFYLFLKKHEKLSVEAKRKEKAESKQNRYLQKLESINKKLNQYAYITSHDLKSPLTSISGLVDLINEADNKKDYREIKTYLTMVQNRVRYMEDLIKGILEYSKIEKKGSKLEEFETKEVVNEIIQILPKERNIQTYISNNLPKLFHSKILFQQVIANLISNSVKYNDKEKVEINVGYQKESDRHLFWIKDNGPGIPKENQSKIFQLFETVNKEDQTSGTGIGLFIAKKITESVNQKIWVESDGKNGSTFYFSWPFSVYQEEEDEYEAG